MAGNKAHTATVHRVAKRYALDTHAEDGRPDLSNENLTVAVETSATLAEGIKALANVEGPVFVAVTNREALADAIRRASRTRVGVMDPQGDIVKQSDPPLEN